MAFREVQVHEIREVLRLWLRGEGLRSAERLAGLDRKTVRRYVAAAQACGLDRAGGEGQLSDELISGVAERVRPHRTGGRLRTGQTIQRSRRSARYHAAGGDGQQLVTAPLRAAAG